MGDNSQSYGGAPAMRPQSTPSATPKKGAVRKFGPTFEGELERGDKQVSRPPGTRKARGYGGAPTFVDKKEMPPASGNAGNASSNPTGTPP